MRLFAAVPILDEVTDWMHISSADLIKHLLYLFWKDIVIMGITALVLIAFGRSVQRAWPALTGRLPSLRHSHRFGMHR